VSKNWKKSPTHKQNLKPNIFLKRMKSFPVLVIVGFGLSLSTTIAVIEGLFSKGGAFIRTPKLNLDNRGKHKQKIDHGYVAPLSSMVWIEIALGIYALFTGVVLSHYIGWGVVPWMVIYMLGFFYIAGLNLIQHAPKTSSSQRTETGAAD